MHQTRVRRSTRTTRLLYALLFAITLAIILSVPMGDGIYCATCAGISQNDPLWWVLLCYLCPGGGSPNGS